MGRRSFVVAVLAVALLTAGCDWTAFGYGPQNTNFNPFEPGLNASSVQHLEEAWSAPCACFERALVAGGVVYVVGGYDEEAPHALSLRTFDAEDGSPRWSASLGSVLRAQVTAVANGLAYVLVTPASETASQRVVAFDATTGAFRWRFIPPVPGGGQAFVRGVIVDGPLAFVAGLTDLFAVDTGGRVVWSRSPGDFVSALTADPAGHIVYAISSLSLTDEPDLWLLSGYRSDGSRVSQVIAEDVFPFAGVETLGFSNGLIIGAQPNEHGEGGMGAFAVHPETGDLAWGGGGGRVEAITPQVTIEFRLREDPATFARDTSTGAVVWSANVGAEAASEGLLYSAGVNGLRINRLSDGTLVTTVPLAAGADGVTPAAGHVYVTGVRLQALVPK
jgi:outer membrane protein assembly factor BamB